MPTLTQQQIDELRELYEKTAQDNGEYLVGPDVENLPYKYEAFVYSRNVAKARFLHRADAELCAAIINAFPDILETLAEKDKRFGETVESFLADISQLRTELRQANERIAELEETTMRIVRDE